MKKFLTCYSVLALITCGAAYNQAKVKHLRFTVGDAVAISVYSPILFPLWLVGQIQDLMKKDMI